jgi:hypothetical protein
MLQLYWTGLTYVIIDEVCATLLSATLVVLSSIATHQCEACFVNIHHVRSATPNSNKLAQRTEYCHAYVCALRCSSLHAAATARHMFASASKESSKDVLNRILWLIQLCFFVSSLCFCNCSVLILTALCTLLCSSRLIRAHICWILIQRRPTEAVVDIHRTVF